MPSHSFMGYDRIPNEIKDKSMKSRTGFFMRSFKRFIIPNDIVITTDGYHYVSFTLKWEDSWERE